MKNLKKTTIYLAFSGGTEEYRKFFKDAVFNELIVDKEVIFRKRTLEVPKDVKGILTIPPQLLEPNVIELVIAFLPGVTWGIKKIVELVSKRTIRESEEVEVIMVIGRKKTKIKMKKKRTKSK